MSQETLTCARCGKSIPPGEAKFGQPLIKAGELVRIALKTPALLAGPPLDEVPYCAECRLLVARERPSMVDASAHVLDTFAGWLPLWQGNHRLQSFPSGHTATAVGLAIALSSLYPRGWWLFAAIAALSGFQRIESESHFLSDVLAGAAIGCLVSAACTTSTRFGRWLTAIERSARQEPRPPGKPSPLDS